MFIMYYLLPTPFGRCCEHDQATVTRILIAFKDPAEKIEVRNAGEIALSM
jgi:hypothetical protein